VSNGGGIFAASRARQEGRGHVSNGGGIFAASRARQEGSR
jgi:hypothetical protein